MRSARGQNQLRLRCTCFASSYVDNSDHGTIEADGSGSKVRFAHDYVDNDGTILGLKAEFVESCGAYPAAFASATPLTTMVFPGPYRVPVTARGRGTGDSGQAVPLAGGLVVDTSRADAVLDVGAGWAQVAAGLAVMGDLASQGELRASLVVELGTNGTFTAAQFDRILSLAAAGRG